MINLRALVPELVVENLSEREKGYLVEVLSRFGGYPSLEQMWRLLDEPWATLGCDPLIMDQRITDFYRHPVWLLNGLFVEQHEQSLESRIVFATWVAEQKPLRIADFGGGFGGLARLIGEALPSAQVEVVEPHPHPAAIALAASKPNVLYVQQLTGEYDLLIATDVFEHVPDPIGLALDTAEYLKVGGQYLIANCFAPVIQCHLPQLFHFNSSWNMVMQSMGLEPGLSVGYGRAYRRKGALSLQAARQSAEIGQRVDRWISWLPRGKARVGRLLFNCFF